VRERIAEAVQRARDTHQPTLIEVITYRFRGHSMSDPANYRTKEEVEEWKKRDPVPLARARLAAEYGASEDELQSLDASVKAEVQEAVRFAEGSPPAEADSVWKYVYADPAVDPRKV
jgi:pyruvate dehydrogenase E1 component alpha subunit